MENNQINSTNQVPNQTTPLASGGVQVSATNPNPIPLPLPPKTTTKNIKENFDKLPKQTKLMIKIAGILFGVVFILLILALLFGKKQKNLVPIPTPSAIPSTPAPNVVFNASRYATDSGVLKIESDLNNFQNQLNSTDVKQGDLSIPDIDFNINFNQ